MSHTPLIGVVGAEHWSYEALITATCLGRITRRGVQIPPNVLYCARKFFDVVLGKETGDTMFDNPPARQCAHSLAWEVLNSCDELMSKDGLMSRIEKEANDYFKKFAALLEKLNKKKAKELLSPEELETAKELQKFFTALYQLGTENARA